MFAQAFFLVTGLLAVGYVGCIYTARFLHQAYQDRNFERALAHSPELASPSVVVLLKIAPAIGFSRSRILGVLLPRRAVAALLAGVALRAGLAWAGAAWARRFAPRAFLGAAAGALLAVSSGIEVVILVVSPLAAVAASRH
jgi:hypothetical protein